MLGADKSGINAMIEAEFINSGIFGRPPGLHRKARQAGGDFFTAGGRGVRGEIFYLCDLRG